jgi:hypothetical protein
MKRIVGTFAALALAAPMAAAQQVKVDAAVPAYLRQDLSQREDPGRG